MKYPPRFLLIINPMNRIKALLKQDWLAALLCMCLFINGFQAGGNQAFLLEIGADLNVETKVLGSLAAAQWLAVAIAPLITGAFADKKGKKPFILIFLFVFLAGSVTLIFTKVLWLYLTCVFILGLSQSIYQSVSMAAMADSYPVSKSTKMAVMTSFYPIGALVAPLLAKAILNANLTWHTFYIIVSAIIALMIIGFFFTNLEKKEEMPETEKKAEIDNPTEKHKLPILAIFCLVFITAVFVGVENGIAYFIKPFVKEELSGTVGELAISLFWLGMIPSRFLCILLKKIQKMNLAVSIILTTVFCVGFSYLSDQSWVLAFAFILGFSCGSIYTLAMSLAVEYVPYKTALATGFITSGTGIGGAAVTFSFSLLSTSFGIRKAFIALGILMATSLITCLLLYLKPKKKEQSLEKTE